MGIELSLDVKKRIQELTENVYEIFNSVSKEKTNWVFAYSGGKDSTLLLLLFYEWLKTTAMDKSYSITLLHNDTLGEINPMEFWARGFMEDMAARFRNMGHDVDVIITVPPAIDTFYWRVIVRGYPAPSNNFRWCVNLLKLKPTQKSLNNIQKSKNNAILLLGSRENESTARQRSLQKRYGGCPLGPGKCHAYYFSTEANTINKVAPIRDWSNADVWSYLRSYKAVNISNLLFLYGCEEARYGCWHCTLVKTQWGFSVLPERYQYLDAVRRIYRVVSDIPALRIGKNNGYSRYGALTASARALLLHLFVEAEKKANIRLYGLDEARVSDGFSLREVFYELEPQASMEIITKEDATIKKDRLCHISTLRDLREHLNVLKSVENLLYSHKLSNPHTIQLLTSTLGNSP